MSKYEGKLGEWLKYLQQQVDSAGKTDDSQQIEEIKDNIETEDEPISVAEIKGRLDRMPASDAQDIEDPAVIADSSRLVPDRDLKIDDPRLFDEEEIPEVETYLPFLRDDNEEIVQEPLDKRIPEPSRLQNLPEGTGEPRPIARDSQKPVDREEKSAQTEPVARESEAVQPTPEKVEIVSPPPPAPKPPQNESIAEANSSDKQQSLLERLPKHIQMLANDQPREVAQNSYSKFKETREEMISRLLDPPLTLEETARILNVCPTTVRRYTNRNLLKHFRTAGNQRRFRLSDVLEFLETTSNRGDAEENNHTVQS